MAVCAAGTEGSMKTTSRVHSPEERAEMRRIGQHRCQRSRWRFIACVTMARTTLTRVIPLAGSAGWWVALVCLLPGLALYGLGCWGLKRRGKECLPVTPILGILTAVALLADGASSMTALATLFTEGVGTPGTQFTLALVAAGMLLFALKRDGLPRGVFLLRWGFVGVLALVLLGYASCARMDHLFPALGGGWSGIRAGIRAGLGMVWPLLLALMEPPVGRRSMVDALPPMLLIIALGLCLCLAIPHEVLMTSQSLGDALVQTVSHLSPFVQLMGICLWMGGLFLSLGNVCSLGADYLLAPWGRELSWLAGVMVLALAGTQTLEIRPLNQVMSVMEPILLVVLALGAGLCWRKK